MLSDTPKKPAISRKLGTDKSISTHAQTKESNNSIGKKFFHITLSPFYVVP
jgi:hypothetical protein